MTKFRIIFIHLRRNIWSHLSTIEFEINFFFNKFKEKLSRQLTIHTDKNSLSSVLNENVYKFALAKEELKKLLHPKYPGNIYSEYSSLFCTGPYFYAELTPKLKIFPSFERSAKNGHRSSLMSTLSSKTKMMKLFKSMQQEDSVIY